MAVAKIVDDFIRWDTVKRFHLKSLAADAACDQALQDTQMLTRRPNDEMYVSSNA